MTSNLDIIRGRQVVAPLTNKSGGGVVPGDVLTVDVANPGSFTTTNIEGDTRVLGVANEVIDADVLGRTLIAGYAPVVNVDAATSIGNFLVTSTTPKSATPKATIEAGVFGIAITSSAGPGTVEAILWVGQGGPQGIAGEQGDTGLPGGVSVQYKQGGDWPETSDGYLKLDNADPTLVASIGLDWLERMLVDVESLVKEFCVAGNRLIIHSEDVPGEFWVYEITGAAEHGVSCTRVPVAYIAHNGDYAGDENILVSVGYEGPQGPAPAGQLVLTARGGSPRSANGCAGAAKIPGLGTNAIDIIALAFSTATQKYAQWAEIGMPSDWDGGTVTAKFYWTCATDVGIADAGVRWSIKGRSWADGEALDAALGAAQEVTDIWIADEDLHVSPETPALTLAGTPAANEHVLFEVSRNVAHADDTLAGDALLIAVLISYTRV